MIHIEKKHILNSIYDSIKFQIILKRFLDDISITDTDIEVLTIFYVHGINDEAFRLILKKKIYKNIQSISNSISNFTKMGIIEKQNNQKVLSSLLDIEAGESIDDQILMTIKLGNK